MLFPIHFESDGIFLLYSNWMLYSSKSDWWCFFLKKSFDIYFIFNFRSTYLTKNHQWLNRDSFRLSWDFLDQQLLIAINRNCYWPTKSQLNQKIFQQIKRYSNFPIRSKNFSRRKDGMHNRLKRNSQFDQGKVDTKNWRSNVKQIYGIAVCGIASWKMKKKLSQSVTNVKQEHLSLRACMCMRTCSFEPKLIAHLFDTRFKHFFHLSLFTLYWCSFFLMVFFSSKIC